MARAGTIVAGKYRLDRVLGRGGMGSVWLASHLELRAPVAVKILDACRTPEVRTRFEREGRAAARIRTPHVAQVHDQGVDEGVPYIVMEYLEGEDLGSRLRREGRITLAAAARVATHAARALRLAHEAGIVHRDLKPSNVFLARAHDDEVVKVLDFGVAKQSLAGGSAELTVTGVLLGTLQYMSPEQLRDPKNADSRSDLWSLAVLLFLAVTGREPFAGSALGDSMSKICFEPIPRATGLLPDLPASIDAFFERAFERDRTRRFQTATELAEAFERVAAEDDDEQVPTQLFDSQRWAGSSWTSMGTERAQTSVLPAFPPPPSSTAALSWTPVPGSLMPTSFGARTSSESPAAMTAATRSRRSKAAMVTALFALTLLMVGFAARRPLQERFAAHFTSAAPRAVVSPPAVEPAATAPALADEAPVAPTMPPATIESAAPSSSAPRAVRPTHPSAPKPAAPPSASASTSPSARPIRVITSAL